MQAETGVATGAVNGLDWVPNEGEDTEVNMQRRGRATGVINRTCSLGNTGEAHASSASATVGLVQVNVAGTEGNAGADAEPSSAELLTRLNQVSKRAAAATIPPVEIVKASRVRPSLQSKQFAEQRATEIAAGVTPRRRKQLHKIMSRLRRKDFFNWHVRCIEQLNQCALEDRWRDVRKWKDVL